MRTLSAILGQGEAVAGLRAAVAGDRLPHALLFTGPEGVGKCTTAVALGRLFLCEAPGADDGCGRCASCVLIDGEDGAHPDLHRVYRELVRIEKKDAKARDLAVDVLRTYFLEPAARSSVMGRGKVFVIDEADTMSVGAQNAILKTLEEPAGRTLIVLVAETPGVLLATIHSRCRTVRFAALSAGVLTAELSRRGLPADAAEFAAGSLGQAMRFARDGVAPHARAVTGAVRAMLDGAGGGETPDLPGLLKKASEAYAEARLAVDDKASKDQATRDGLGLYLRLATGPLREALLAGGDARRLDAVAGGVDAAARAIDHLEMNVNTALAVQQFAATLERLLRR